MVCNGSYALVEGVPWLEMEGFPSGDCEGVEGQEQQNSCLGTPSGWAGSFLSGTWFRQLVAENIGMAEEGEVEEEEGKKM